MHKNLRIFIWRVTYEWICRILSNMLWSFDKVHLIWYLIEHMICWMLYQYNLIHEWAWILNCELYLENIWGLRFWPHLKFKFRTSLKLSQNQFRTLFEPVPWFLSFWSISRNSCKTVLCHQPVGNYFFDHSIRLIRSEMTNSSTLKVLTRIFNKQALIF